MDHKPKLLDQVRTTIRLKHYSIRTEQAYMDWIKRFILFHHKRHPAAMGLEEVRAFLSHLATVQQVASSTQRQALSAIVFLYREILGRETGWIDHIERAKQPERLPVVYSRAETRAVLAHLDGQHWLMASLLYGTGLRLMECVRFACQGCGLCLPPNPGQEKARRTASLCSRRCWSSHCSDIWGKLRSCTARNWRRARAPRGCEAR
jgi:site-specific recombinase XerD